MRKVLIVANNSGGLYRFRKDLIIKILELGNEVIALTPFDDKVDELKNLGIELIETPIDRRGINPLTDSKLLLKYFKLIKSINPDLVITYTIKPNVYAGLACRILKKKYACNITGLGTAFQNNGLLSKVVSVLYKMSLKKVFVVFFENEENKNVIVNKKIINKNKCVVLNGAGVNLSEYKFENYPDNNNNIHFLFIGRVMKEKGIDEFIECASRIKKENSNVFFDVIGPMEDDYTSIIKEVTDKNIINYYGFQSDVKPFIKQSHCFVLPSYHEGMANTNLESAAMGRPLITSNIHGCKEAVINGVNGLLCEKENVESLYSCMKKFIDLSYEEKVRMGFESRKHMENVFDKEKVVEMTVKGLEV